MADFDRDGLIFTNSTKQDFLRARVCIEEPLFFFPHQRYREGPVLRADVQHPRSVELPHKPMHLLEFRSELPSSGFVVLWVIRKDYSLRTPRICKIVCSRSFWTASYSA